MQIVARRLARGEIDYELVWLGASLASLGIAVAWFVVGLPWPRCVFHEVTGMPCVTCGMTRCAIQFFHGHFLAALKWNPLVFAAQRGEHEWIPFQGSEEMESTRVRRAVRRSGVRPL